MSVALSDSYELSGLEFVIDSYNDNMIFSFKVLFS